jgi:hypothetical protein
VPHKLYAQRTFTGGGVLWNRVIGGECRDAAHDRSDL